MATVPMTEAEINRLEALLEDPPAGAEPMPAPPVDVPAPEPAPAG